MKRNLIKKTLILTAVFLVGFSLLFQQVSHSHGYYHGSAWWVPGAFLGGVFLGAAITRPWYPPPVYVYPAPAPVYVYPPPVYVYPPRQAYAYPDPDYAPKAKPESPPGEWVTVPGQWVGGKWVPEHRVWVPVNP